MTTLTTTEPSETSLDVRDRLVDALRLDLYGPWAGHGLSNEQLPSWVRPSNWYLTGFLIPSGMSPEKRGDADEDDDLEVVPEFAGLGEESNEERKAAKKGFFPSSMGLSFLLPKEAQVLSVIVRWGDYTLTEIDGDDGKPLPVWQRKPDERTVSVHFMGAAEPAVHAVAGSGGLELHVVEKLISAEDLEQHIPHGTRSVSVFLVNNRTPDEEKPDAAYAFQAKIEVRSEHPFVPRPDMRGAQADDWDDQVADLHYADTPEYATGHGVSVEWQLVDNVCRELCSAWIPNAEVQKTTTVAVPGVELSMDALGASGAGTTIKP